MRRSSSVAGLLLLTGLVLSGLAGVPAAAQTPKDSKAPARAETRYFTHLTGLMEDQADVVLKDIRQNGRTTAAELDVCFPALTDPNRIDRFVVNLAISGQTLSGTTQSVEGKVPVAVNLTRTRRGNTFDFSGNITIGSEVSEIVSIDDSDLSEQEFREQQATEDTIIEAPADFTEVSPEAVAVRVKREAVVDFARSLRGENVQVALIGLIASCAELRSGEQMLRLTVDPERAPSVIETLRTRPGVITAGWTDGNMDMERTIRFPAAEWREAGKIARDKIAATASNALATSLAATFVSSKWNDATGELTARFKRPSSILPALGLVENIEVTAIVAPEKPGGADHLLLWAGSPSIETVDESSGPKLNLVDNETGNEEETVSVHDEPMLAALAKQFRAQRWDGDLSAWTQ
jgi:hypothetical protein